MPKNAQIDASKIRDWDSFHEHFSETLGFPELYGRNMNAWVDCMTYLDDPNGTMTTIHVETGAVLVLCVSGARDLKKRCPKLYDALIECTAFVNYRRIAQGRPAVLALSFHE